MHGEIGHTGQSGCVVVSSLGGVVVVVVVDVIVGIVGNFFGGKLMLTRERPSLLGSSLSFTCG